MDECPTICDPDCEAGATHCGELHLPSHKRAHDPDSCFAETMDWAIRGWMATLEWAYDKYGHSADYHDPNAVIDEMIAGGQDDGFRGAPQWLKDGVTLAWRWKI